MTRPGAGPLSLAAAARDAAERPALVTPEGTLTWSGLRDAAAREAAAFAAGVDGIDVAGRVVVVAGSDRRAIVRMLAAIDARVPAVLLHPAWTGRERRRALALVAADDAAPERPAPGGPDDPALALAVAFTSGSDGAPAGVVLSRGAFAASARASAARLGWREEDRWLLCLPTAHVGGLSVLTRCLLARRTIVAMPRFDADAVAEAIAERRATLVSLVPAMLARLLGERPAWVPPAHLRAVLLGGASAPEALLAEARARGVPVLTTYGLTEACSQVATQRPGTPPGPEQGCGPPLPGIGVELGVGGEILVSGPTLLSARLGRRGAALDRRGRLLTGDTGRLDEAGRLHFTGRIADTIVTGGENVAPAEVETVVTRCPGVAEALVFGVPDETWGEVVALAVTPASPNGPDPAELAHVVARGLAPFKWPRRYAVVARLPHTRGGKPDRRGAARALAGALRPLPRHPA